MKIVSFNVNSIRVRLHQIEKIINKYSPEILSLQETRVEDNLFPFLFFKNFNYYPYCYGQKSYHGVAIITKSKPTKILSGFTNKDLEKNKRIITVKLKTEIGELLIVNCYSPQGGYRKCIRKFQEKKIFYKNLYLYLKNLLKRYPLLILTGDMNIAPVSSDIGIGEINKKIWIKNGKCSFLPEEKEWITKLESLGLIDIFRKRYPYTKNVFSWFSYRSNCFYRNHGLRIDLILVSKLIYPFLKKVNLKYKIRNMKKPSDHVPVIAEFKFKIL
ncbi:hypothetical protein AOQ88_00345 [Candidatus Riesia sp. GBBU]|nr:hypothetical protein AOQ88_00345 [Candidatus Riesia sp. GBBU]